MKIVESHHEALPAWAELRTTLPAAPRLITLDHHTDTSKPFRNHIRRTYGPNFAKEDELRAAWLAAMDPADPGSLAEAMAKLSNDEHIVAAIKTDMISDAFVIAHNAMDTDVQTYRDHRIMCRSVTNTLITREAARQDCDKVLESHFLHTCLTAFDEAVRAEGQGALLAGPYILDIDLDYLNTFASVDPRDSSVLRGLARGASLITIATEPAYVHTCSLDPGLTSDHLLQKLIQLLNQEA